MVASALLALGVIAYRSDSLPPPLARARASAMELIGAQFLEQPKAHVAAPSLDEVEPPPAPSAALPATPASDGASAEASGRDPVPATSAKAHEKRKKAVVRRPSAKPAATKIIDHYGI
jgi:hypothetical protein